MSKVKKASGRNLESITSYCRDLQDKYSKLLAVRIDLGYNKEHASECSLEEIKKDVKHMLDNRRANRSLFQDQVGYIFKFEDAEEKGPMHMHCYCLMVKRCVRMLTSGIRSETIGMKRSPVGVGFFTTVTVIKIAMSNAASA